MNKEQLAIARLRLAAEMSETYYHAPLVITTSGGKDSDVCLALARAAGIRYEVQHNHTSVDAPETVYHVRETFHRLENEGIKCTVNLPTYKGARVTMWNLIPQKLMPPTRVVRYCCSVLKEQGGKGRMITTGVRWAESAKRRKNRGIYEKQSADISRRITISNDNDDTRRLFENCRLQAKRVCNPIVDWTGSDVWDYIRSEHIPVNPLYERGFHRVGCIGCPLAGRAGRQFEFGRYPTYERAYLHAFERMLAERRHRKLPAVWQSGEEVLHWWLQDGVLPGQLSISDYLTEME